MCFGLLSSVLCSSNCNLTCESCTEYLDKLSDLCTDCEMWRKKTCKCKSRKVYRKNHEKARDQVMVEEELRITKQSNQQVKSRFSQIFS
jgi:hypothetical protein